MRNSILQGLHVVFALFLLLVAFPLHGRVPGMSADESAALGFLLFFGLGLPALVMAVGILAASILARWRWSGTLAGTLVVSVVFTMLSVWTGIAASLGYLGFASWVVVDRKRQRAQQARP